MSVDQLKVRARAPLRLGLAGGGTDLSPYCDEFGGCALNVTIDRYAYAHLASRGDGRSVFEAHDLGIEDIDDGGPPGVGALRIHRAVHDRIVRTFLNGQKPCITVSTSVDAVAGSGLGSSSALVVALVELYREAFGLPLGRYDVAHLAFEIERIDLGLAGGKQDHYAAAFGGMNFIEFMAHDRVIVNPLRIADPALNELEASMITCFTGQSRDSDEIIREQVKGVKSDGSRTVESFHQLKQDAIEMKRAVIVGDLRTVVEVLGRTWIAKRFTAAAVSNPLIENVFSLAMKNGALAGKVSGAGGGGFIMFLAVPESRQRLVSALRSAGFDTSPVSFTLKGVEAWKVPG
jgi:D-glycero-alpha-D-manno-heptose-7-phosphate kinase